METIAIGGNLDMDENTQQKLDALATKINEIAEEFSGMKSTISYIEKTVGEIKACYVTIVEFKPIRTVVYTIVSLAGVSIIAAFFRWVVIK